MAEPLQPLAPSSVQEFGLPATALASVRNTLSQCPRLQRALVYGSRARGDYRRGSDLDLVLDGAELTFSDLAHLEAELDDLLLPWTMDLSLLTQLDNPALQERIARDGKVLWSSPHAR